MLLLLLLRRATFLFLSPRPSRLYCQRGCTENPRHCPCGIHNERIRTVEQRRANIDTRFSVVRFELKNSLSDDATVVRRLCSVLDTLHARPTRPNQRVGRKSLQ